MNTLTKRQAEEIIRKHVGVTGGGPDGFQIAGEDNAADALLAASVGDTEKKLFEVSHPYYCADENHLTNDAGQTFDSWEEFLAEYGDADLDWNLVFRFDWVRPGDGFDDVKTEALKIYFLQQRRGHFIPVRILGIKREDEPAIRAWLLERYQHLQSLWAPLSGVEEFP